MADRRRATVLVMGVVALGGVAVAGYLVTGGGGEAAVADPWLPTGSAAVSPPPVDPEDVATDTAVPTEAAVQITYSGPDEAAGGVAVGAYVAGLVEDGGRCAMTLSLEGSSASTETDAVADASATSCGQMLVPFAELSAGTWEVDVTYSSPGGKSVAPAHGTVEVP